MCQHRVRQLLQDVWNSWGQVGPSNNTCELLIGLLLKLRSATMRGFQKEENLKRFVHLNSYLWSHREDCQVSALLN